MPKSSSLPYDAPFRYTRPAKDLQAIFGAQTGNPPIVPVENAKAGKLSRVGKKSPSAATRKSSKASKPKASKPAASKAKAKAKKPAARR
jgi:hypothetical protein